MSLLCGPGHKVAPKVSTSTMTSVWSQYWTALPLTWAWNPVFHRGLNLGLIFWLHGTQMCLSQRQENTRFITLQGDGVFLTPGCPGSLAPDSWKVASADP